MYVRSIYDCAIVNLWNFLLELRSAISSLIYFILCLLSFEKQFICLETTVMAMLNVATACERGGRGRGSRRLSGPSYQANPFAINFNQIHRCE